MNCYWNCRVSRKNVASSGIGEVRGIHGFGRCSTTGTREWERRYQTKFLTYTWLSVMIPSTVSSFSVSIINGPRGADTSPMQIGLGLAGWTSHPRSAASSKYMVRWNLSKWERRIEFEVVGANMNNFELGQVVWSSNVLYSWLIG